MVLANTNYRCQKHISDSSFLANYSVLQIIFLPAPTPSLSLHSYRSDGTLSRLPATLFTSDPAPTEEAAGDAVRVR